MEDVYADERRINTNNTTINDQEDYYEADVRSAVQKLKIKYLKTSKHQKRMKNNINEAQISST